MVLKYGLTYTNIQTTNYYIISAEGLVKFGLMQHWKEIRLFLDFNVSFGTKKYLICIAAFDKPSVFVVADFQTRLKFPYRLY